MIISNILFLPSSRPFFSSQGTPKSSLLFISLEESSSQPVLPLVFPPRMPLKGNTDVRSSLLLSSYILVLTLLPLPTFLAFDEPRGTNCNNWAG
jgi:hypothetical protein